MSDPDVHVRDGDIIVRAATVGEASVLVAEIRRVFTMVKQQEFRITITHGHEFGRDRRCSCGMPIMDYHMLDLDAREMCKDWKAVLETPVVGDLLFVSKGEIDEDYDEDGSGVGGHATGVLNLHGGRDCGKDKVWRGR